MEAGFKHLKYILLIPYLRLPTLVFLNLDS